jgi:tetratricopeptide (TPR) repeat protein
VISTTVLLLFALLLAQGAGPTTALADAKLLYASASYEEALLRLATVQTDQDEVDKYRALCLIALGRNPEAERALERIVGRSPLYTVTDDDDSPRLIAMLHDVRHRLLPQAARDAYATARSEFDQQHYGAAEAGFQQALAILGDPDVKSAGPELADLRIVGEGFLKLARVQLEAQREAAIAAAASNANAAAPRIVSAPPAPTPPKLYSAEDAGVVEPREISRTMPVWVAPRNTSLSRVAFEGTLEIVIDEHGQVAAAAIRKSILPPYDAKLIEATKHWQFAPATKDGEPVRYRKVFDIVLRGAQTP